MFSPVMKVLKNSFFVSVTPLFFIVLALSTVTAQPAPSLVGVWQSSISLGEGLPVAIGVLRVLPGGHYREEMRVEGQLGAFWEGTYTLAPDGTLTQTALTKSPQVCVQSNCQTNEGEAVTVARATFPNPNTLVLSLPDGSVVLEYQRVTDAAPAPAPATLLDNPLGGQQGVSNNFWFGSYSNGDLTLDITEFGKYFIEQAGIRYPLTIPEQYPLDIPGMAPPERLEGSFSSNGADYPVVLERYQGSLVMLTSGQSRFVLERVVPVTAPSIPLD